MNILRPVQLIITTILLLIFSNSIFSQKIEPKKRITEPDHTITSKILERDYKLYISFPKNYSTKNSISYPVLYVLDGQCFYPIITGTRELLGYVNEIEDIIIVGISASNFSVDRHYDYTTSVDTAYDKEEDKSHDKPKGTYKSGGAAKFLESLKTEIIPFVDKNYKTNSDRGIAGSCLGGSFTAYCLVNSDGYFTRFSLGSPSLMLDNEKLLNQAVTQFKENKTWDLPQTKVYISVGDNEGNPEQMPPMIKFSKYLEHSNYDTIKLNGKFFTTKHIYPRGQLT